MRSYFVERDRVKSLWKTERRKSHSSEKKGQKNYSGEEIKRSHFVKRQKNGETTLLKDTDGGEAILLKRWWRCHFAERQKWKISHFVDDMEERPFCLKDRDQGEATLLKDRRKRSHSVERQRWKKSHFAEIQDKNEDLLLSHNDGAHDYSHIPLGWPTMAELLVQCLLMTWCFLPLHESEVQISIISFRFYFFHYLCAMLAVFLGFSFILTFNQVSHWLHLYRKQYLLLLCRPL